MRISTRLTIALGVLVVASAACGAEAPVVAEPTTPTSVTGTTGPALATPTTVGFGFEIPGDLGDAPLVLPPVDPGTLLERRWIDRDTARVVWSDPVIDPGGLLLTLDACRIRYPGQWAFDVTVVAPDGVGFPITLGLDFGWGYGDVWTGAPPMEVDLAAPGTFTVTYDSAGYLREHLDLFVEFEARDREQMPHRLLSDASGQRLVAYEGAGCDLDVGFSPDAALVDDRVRVEGDEVVADLVAPEVTAKEGTVEYLAQTADLSDRSAPGRAWAQLYGHGWSPAAYVVWLLPDRAFSSITEEWAFSGRCHTLRIQYHHDEGDPFELWQYRDCPSDGPGPDQATATLQVREGEWTVVAGGEDQAVVDDAIARLQPYFVTDPLPAPAAFAGGTIATTEFEGATVYLVQIDHGNGIREILLESSDLDVSDGPGSGANGETFRGCWQTTVYRDAGVALVLVGDPAWLVRVGGTTLDLQQADGGIGYALMAWTSNSPPHPTITTADGTVPCS